MRRHVLISLALGLSLAALPALGQESEPPQKPDAPAAPAKDGDATAQAPAPSSAPKPSAPLPSNALPKGKPLVITNDVLESRYAARAALGSSSQQAQESADATGADGKKAGNTYSAGKAGGAVDPTKRAAELRDELSRLRRRAASMRNPYLARVAPTEKEAASESGLGNAERISMTESRIAQVEAELERLATQSRPADAGDGSNDASDARANDANSSARESGSE